ncbi:hypothetical protein REPUB_Repub06bG0117300 [Reevesia pubescens]
MSINGFRLMIEDCNLIDLQFQGSRYSWTNNKDENLIKARLDRVLVNVELGEKFPKIAILISQQLVQTMALSWLNLVTVIKKLQECSSLKL